VRTTRDPFAEQLAAARPDADRGVARRLALEGVLAAVVGDRPPPTIGRYRVEARVGAGGMGVVYRARDDERTVAIKLLDAPLAHERARFGREARLLREVVHPHVVAYLDHGVMPEDVDYLVMEWLDGRDLGRRLQESGPLSIADALRTVLAAARGLGAVHRAGIVHRDVKPSNLFLVGDAIDAVRVVDFGVSRALSSATHLTVSGAVVGTPSYVAPEQLRGLADTRADVYGLGAVLFECLTGRPPFVGEHVAAILSAVIAEPAPSVASFRVDVPTEVDLWVARMLEKDPDDRPRDMEAVATSVASLLSELASRRDGRRVLSRLERVTPRRPIAPPSMGALVGRERERATALGALAASRADEEAVWIEVVGAPGFGKTALLDALDAEGHVVRLRARDANAPFSVLAALAQQLALHEPSCAPAHAELVARLGDARSEAHDPLVVADRILLAWLELLDAAAATTTPWTVLLDDAERADLPSLRLLDRALAQLDARAFALVTARRPDAACAIGADFDPARRATINLGPLRPRAAARLAARARPDADESAWRRAAALGGGHPARVLACALADDDRAHGFDDRTLAALDPETRRVLRAAAIVGIELDLESVAALVDVDVELVERHLARAPDVVTRAPSWRFVNEAVHAATYALCTDADRHAGHLALAARMRARPQVDVLALAHHLRSAGDTVGAAPHHLALARAALAGGDGASFDVHLACAREGTPDDPRLAWLEAQARFWRGDVAGAKDAAERARRASSLGSLERFAASSQLVTCAGQLGDDATSTTVALAAAEEPALDEATRAMRFVVLARAASQLFARPHAGLDAKIRERIGDAVTPEARAWRHRVDAIHEREHLDRASEAHEAAHRAHAEQGDWRSAAQMALYLGSYRVWAGAWERARDAIDDALRLARRLGAEYLTTWGRYVEAKLLVEVAPGDARVVLDDVIARTAASPRIHTGAHVYAALAAHRLGDLERAVRHAELARAGSGLARVASAALVRAWLAMGKVDEARALLPALAGDAREPELDELVRLASAELAPETLPDALARLDARAATIADPLRRDHYLTRPHLVVATRALV
jgi:tRNA A-37 threonylcarbamoyl transferase component Bud32